MEQDEINVLLKCLKSVVHLDDETRSEALIKTEVPAARNLSSPSNLRWKPGAVTEFMNRHNISVQNDPRDSILKEILTGDSKNHPPPAPPKSTKLQDYRNRFGEDSSSKVSHFNKLARLPCADYPESRRQDTIHPITNSTGASKRQFNFSKNRRHFSPPRFISTASKPVQSSVEPVEVNIVNANTNFEKPSLFSTVTTSAVKTNGGVFQGSWKRKRDEDITDVDVLPVKIEKTDVVAVDRGPFKSAKEQLVLNDRAKGIKRPTLNRSPVQGPIAKKPLRTQKEDSPEGVSENAKVNELMSDERMKNVDPKMVEAILNEVIEVGSSTDWDDIAGLKGVKEIIKEIIIWPMLRPDIFTGLRGPPKGILLFGPPGTGKTMIGRLIATQSKSTFFNISASSLTSKWIGDGEKMVRTLFQVARVKQPAVIFIDEIDSILTQRNDTEHESSRRLKTEFLIQFDGCGSKSEDRILVIGVTNRPQELDEAARRRLVKRIYIPLPDTEGRQQLVERVIVDQSVNLVKSDYEKIAEMTEGYSGADMACLCKEAAYGPIRDIGVDIQDISVDKVRPMELSDFASALKHVKASVMAEDLTLYENWDKQFGCHV